MAPGGTRAARRPPAVPRVAAGASEHVLCFLFLCFCFCTSSRSLRMRPKRCHPVPGQLAPPAVGLAVTQKVGSTPPSTQTRLVPSLLHPGSWVFPKCSRQAPTSGPLHMFSPLPIKLCVPCLPLLSCYLIPMDSGRLPRAPNLNPSPSLLSPSGPVSSSSATYFIHFICSVFLLHPRTLGFGLSYPQPPEQSAGTQQVPAGRTEK